MASKQPTKKELIQEINRLEKYIWDLEDKLEVRQYDTSSVEDVIEILFGNQIKTGSCKEADASPVGNGIVIKKTN